MKQEQAQKAVELFSIIIICLLAGVLGSIFTMDSIPTWYAGLNKPSFNPPNWIFGPVWTTLYILMGIAAYFVWRKRKKNKDAKIGLWIFGIQLIFNALWSIVFFGMHQMLAAFVVVIALWILILLTIFYFFRVQKVAGYLLIPYILWVSFASVLNYTIWMLN